MVGVPAPAIVADIREEGVKVNRFAISTALAAALAAALAGGSAVAGSGSPSVSVQFRASFSGTAVVRVNGQQAAITANGTGPARILGKSRISGTLGKSKLVGRGTGSNSDPCPLFGGTATITAVNGMKLNFTIPAAGGSGCTDEQAQLFSLSGRATVTGGTGKYVRTKGVLRFAGSFNRGTGAFTVAFNGALRA
jgi:hypothetical protein